MLIGKGIHLAFDAAEPSLSADIRSALAENENIGVFKRYESARKGLGQNLALSEKFGPCPSRQFCRRVCGCFVSDWLLIG